MHGFVYAASFRGAPGALEGTSRTGLFFRYTVPGYAIALVVSMYVLWTFGRYEGNTATTIIMQAVVLGFPASIGAAAARLVV
jgi:uncharacterized membrane protein